MPQFSSKAVLDFLAGEMRANDQHAGPGWELCQTGAGQLQRIIQVVVRKPAILGVVQPYDQATSLEFFQLVDGLGELQQATSIFDDWYSSFSQELEIGGTIEPVWSHGHPRSNIIIQHNSGGKARMIQGTCCSYMIMMMILITQWHKVFFSKRLASSMADSNSPVRPATCRMFSDINCLMKLAPWTFCCLRWVTFWIRRALSCFVSCLYSNDS